MDNKLLCSVCDFYFVPAEVPQCTRCGYVEPDAIPSSYDVAKNKDKKLQYSEYLKWSKGLSVKIERADIKLIMNALNEFYISDASSENDLKDIDALKEKIKLLQNSPFRRFIVTPVFTQEDKV